MDNVFQNPTVVKFLPWLAGTASVWVIETIKARQNLIGRKALYLAVAVSVVFGILVMLLSGEITSENLNWESVPEILASIFAASQLVYQFNKQKDKSKKSAKNLTDQNDEQKN